MHEAVRAILVGDSALAALVGTRVNWMLRPQQVTALPAVILRTVSAPREYDMAGPCGLVDSRLQVDVWAETYGAAKVAARAAMAALSGFRGTSAGTEIKGAFVINERDLQEDDTGEVNRLFGTSFDVRIWHDE